MRRVPSRENRVEDLPAADSTYPYYPFSYYQHMSKVSSDGNSVTRPPFVAVASATSWPLFHVQQAVEHVADGLGHGHPEGPVRDRKRGRTVCVRSFHDWRALQDEGIRRVVTVCAGERHQ